jgi:hypothetical protein
MWFVLKHEKPLGQLFKLRLDLRSIALHQLSTGHTFSNPFFGILRLTGPDPSYHPPLIPQYLRLPLCLLIQFFCPKPRT